MQQPKSSRGRYSCFKVEFSNYKILTSSDPMPEGYQWLVEGCPVAVPIHWLNSVLEQCQGRSPSFVLTMIINGMLRPHEVIHGGTSAYIGTYMEPVINALKCNLSQHQPPQPVPAGVRPGCGYVHPSDAHKWMKKERRKEERKMAEDTPVVTTADTAASGQHRNKALVKQTLAGADSSIFPRESSPPEEDKQHMKLPVLTDWDRTPFPGKPPHPRTNDI
ncbi:hypothetical protein ACOMHN_023000 [Nucella lapillus]